MQRIAQRLRTIEPKQAALLLAVAALAAAAMYFGGREAGVGRPTEAGTTVAQEQPAEPAPQNSSEEPSGESGVEPLLLTLKAPTICRVKPADRDLHAIAGPIDEDGENEERYEFGEWFGVANVLVRWRASGGTPPYTLAIDGEPRDAHNEYVGEAGGALVSCALEIGETYFDDRWGESERWHRTEPTVDSGLKTIHAMVTDSSGVIASTSIEVHAVLETGGGFTVLEAGKTYRVEGRLMTVPEGIDITIGDMVESDCEGTDCQNSLEFFAKDGPHRVAIALGIKTGEEYGLRSHLYWENGTPTRLPADDPRNAGGVSEHPLHQKFDEFAESFGQPPRLKRCADALHHSGGHRRRSSRRSDAGPGHAKLGTDQNCR